MKINYIHDIHNENEIKERDIRTHIVCAFISFSYCWYLLEIIFFITNFICNSTFHRPEFL